MKKFWLGFGSGVLATILLLAAWIFLNTLRFKRGPGVLDDIARHDVEQALPGARVLDVVVSTEPESSAKVNYVHDHLYDVPVTYKKGASVKQITLTYGITRGVWISPTTADIVIADDHARIVQALGGKEKSSP